MEKLLHTVTAGLVNFPVVGHGGMGDDICQYIPGGWMVRVHCGCRLAEAEC